MEEKVERGGAELLTFYACPICRFTFRANLNVSSAVQCPGCDLLVRVKADVNVIRSSKDELDKVEQLRMASWEKDDEAVSTISTEDKEHNQSSFSKYLLLAVILLIICTSIGGMVILFTSQGNTDSDLKRVNPVVATKTIIGESVSEELLSSRTIEAIKKDAFQYFNTFKVEEFWDIIDQSDLEKQNIAKLLEVFPKQTWSDLELTSTPTVKEEILLAKFGNAESEQLLIFKKLDGKFVIDWASTTGYSEDQIAMLKTGAKEEIILRVRLKQKDYYTANVSEFFFKSFSIKISFEQLSVFGYVERENEDLITQLDNITRFGNGRATLVLARFTNEVGDNQYIIKEVIADNWHTNFKD